MMRPKKGKMILPIIGICGMIVLTICAGCTDSVPADITDGDITAIPGTVSPTSSTGEQVYGNIVIDVPDFVQHWKPDGTCYWEGRIHVANTGDAPEMNVVIRSYLIRVADGEREDVDSNSFTRINPGEPLSFVSQLYGTCDEEYYIVVKADTE
ncbi:hypothetical protein [Methanogenium sp. MK-MG]|uniref:hypothetical protein n=1 Tax=Methanogenium sp. MK-MG TaxID=2599926 RepID=UPI0013E9FA8C|nr:hypothetical protein [Methanogenium sp. MK-MG]